MKMIMCFHHFPCEWVPNSFTELIIAERGGIRSEQHRGRPIESEEKLRAAILQNRFSLCIGPNLLGAKLFACYGHKSQLILAAALPILLQQQY